MTIHQYQLFRLGNNTHKVPITHLPGTTESSSSFVIIEDIQDFFPNARRFELEGNPIPFLKDPKGNRIQPLRISIYPDKTLEVITNLPEPTTHSVLVAPTTGSLETQSSQDIIRSSQTLINSFNSTLNTRSLADITSLKADLERHQNILEKRAKENNVKDKDILKEMTQMQQKIKEQLISIPDTNNVKSLAPSTIATAASATNTPAITSTPAASTSSSTFTSTATSLKNPPSQELVLSSQNLVDSYNSTLIANNLSDIGNIGSDLAYNLGALEKRVMKDNTESKEVLYGMVRSQQLIKDILIENSAKTETMLRMQLDAKEADVQVLKLQLESKEKTEKLLQMTEQMVTLQNQTLDRLATLQNCAETILVQNFELHEYPIPRLFIILPVDQSKWNPLKVLENKFRLFFLCECGGHPMEANKKIQNHIHIAKHEGYEIRNSTEFYRRYGKYILILLQALQIGVDIADKSIPSIHAPKASDPSINYAISYIKALSVEDPTLKTISTIDDYEALEGTDLRQLEKYLQINDNNRKLGNLYRITIDTGHVRWVCIDHYRSTYKEKEQRAFENVVEVNGGTYDAQHGKVIIVLKSRIRANEFFNSLARARHVYELDAEFAWECTKSDIEFVTGALRKSQVSALRLDIRHFQLGTLKAKIFPPTIRYELFSGIVEHQNIKRIHIILPGGFTKLPSLQPKKSSPFHKLSYEIAPHQMKPTTFLVFVDALKTDKTLTTLNLTSVSIGKEGVMGLSAALRVNNTLEILDLSSNLIKKEGAIALSEALKTNINLTTLNLDSNSIGNEGAIALSDALKTNSALTTLNLGNNSIGKDGATRLLVALKTNTTLNDLDMSVNSIANEGAVALSEALKINNTLTTLNLHYNSIGNEGAIALSESLKSNTSLTTLNLSNNSIGNEGAIGFSEALKSNTTLTNLNLACNSIGNEGAIKLSDTLKINITLANLDMKNNPIGNEVTVALLKAPRPILRIL